MSDSLQPHGLQHARLPCPSPLPELVQTHVHQVDDAIQPCHPLSSPSPPAFNLSQLQGLFQWVSSPCQVTKVLELQLQHQSFQWIFLFYWLVWYSCRPKDSQESSPTRQFKHQFFGTQLSLCSSSYIHTWLMEKTIDLTRWTFVGKLMPLLFNILTRFVIG